MRQISVFDRILLLITSILAAYQIVVGIEGSGTLATTSYTVGFGILLVACLLLIIQGFQVLDNPLVVILSTIIPLSISVGLIAQFSPQYSTAYLVFAIAGLLAVTITRFAFPGRTATIVLIIVHGIAGLVIFFLPIILSITGTTPAGFILVGIGGGLIGIGGLLLSFLRAGKPILKQDTILSILPALLLLTTACFVLGFSFV